MTLACEDANSKLVDVVTVADVDDEDLVGNSFFSSDFQTLVSLPFPKNCVEGDIFRQSTCFDFNILLRHKVSTNKRLKKACKDCNY